MTGVPPDLGCPVPPEGWWCSREPGHDGPCAAWPTPVRQRRWLRPLVEVVGYLSIFMMGWLLFAVETAWGFVSGFVGAAACLYLTVDDFRASISEGPTS